MICLLGGEGRTYDNEQALVRIDLVAMQQPVITVSFSFFCTKNPTRPSSSADGPACAAVSGGTRTPVRRCAAFRYIEAAHTLKCQFFEHKCSKN